MDATWGNIGMPTFMDYWQAPPLQPVAQAEVLAPNSGELPLTIGPSSFDAFKIGLVLVAIVAAGILLSYYIERAD